MEIQLYGPPKIICMHVYQRSLNSEGLFFLDFGGMYSKMYTKTEVIQVIMQLELLLTLRLLMTLNVTFSLTDRHVTHLP